ncbi:SRPBCC family protein [Pseudomonas jinjuensis]|uniref:Polyketide cyclase / dehydrase and lipid transport n=1 Tax=Pseudomonas jinjuensis TaxID=198616 RepID=A0A1H0EKM4_9PSED|nr:SRPBCC family protein [Pseudomonas jinjuensis]SDN82893.1 Polyketide cyclase / dehydrase and lipid transport [Pseudomonas jinjuensis]
MRQRIITHHDFKAPARRLWELLADFADIQRWWPLDDDSVKIERVELEGEGIGLTRHIYNVGFPAPVSERLDYQDVGTLTYRLSIVGQRPAGILDYQATGRIEILSGGGSRLHYHSDYSVERGREEEAEAFLRGAYGLMFRGLEKAAR